MKLVRGGYNTYGFTIGILMLESSFPRIPGDTGNASSFRYPVRLRPVKGADHQRLILERDPTLLEPFIGAARDLEAQGVKAITTNCGFLALFQKQLAASLSVPVFTSSLMMVPMIASMLGPDQKLGIMTVNASALGEEHYNGVGWSSEDYPIVVAGMEHEPLFTKVFVEDRHEFDVQQMEADMINVAKRLVTEHPDVAAILFECTNMPPYSHAVQGAVGLPVFHIFGLIDLVFQAFHWKPYDGFM
jgi:Asp/Glu/hydantoin racemase